MSRKLEAQGQKCTIRLALCCCAFSEAFDAHRADRRLSCTRSHTSKLARALKDAQARMQDRKSVV